MDIKPGPGHRRGGRRQTYENDQEQVELGQRVLPLLAEGPKNFSALCRELDLKYGSKLLDKTLQRLRKQDKIHYSKTAEGGIGAWKLGKRP